jgi:hypothetical protein
MDYFEEITKFILAHASNGESGIENLSTEKLIFFPNPVRNIIRFATDTGTISIYDLTGREVLSTTIRSGQADVSSIKAGVYIILIQSEGKIQTSKFIKQ